MPPLPREFTGLTLISGHKLTLIQLKGFFLGIQSVWSHYAGLNISSLIRFILKINNHTQYTYENWIFNSLLQSSDSA